MKIEVKVNTTKSFSPYVISANGNMTAGFDTTIQWFSPHGNHTGYPHLPDLRNVDQTILILRNEGVEQPMEVANCLRQAYRDVVRTGACKQNYTYHEDGKVSSFNDELD